jgi:5-carboxymethyl-2-hydroxymuconate isomerase
MPHLTLEYTDNLTGFQSAPALVAINEAAFATGLFGESDIKTRAVKLDAYRTGIHVGARGFVHVRIAMLAGRTDAERKNLAEAVLAVLKKHLGEPAGMEVQLSVETVELHRESYAKAVLHG